MSEEIVAENLPELTEDMVYRLKDSSFSHSVK